MRATIEDRGDLPRIAATKNNELKSESPRQAGFLLPGSFGTLEEH